MGHFIKDLVMNVSEKKINEVFIMVGRGFFNNNKSYKMKVTRIKCDLGKGHVPFHSTEGKHNFHFYDSLYTHILSI